MVDADQLRIVFHVNGGGFVMLVADFLEIRCEVEGALTAVEQPDSPLQTGFMIYRETDVAVYTLTSLFELPETDSNVESQLLVFMGADCPWVVQVDHGTRVKASAQFKYQKNEKRKTKNEKRKTKNEKVDSGAVSGFDPQSRYVSNQQL
jgi:hypothetical protein